MRILPPDHRRPEFLSTSATRKALSKEDEFTTEDKELAKTNVVNRQVIIESKRGKVFNALLSCSAALISLYA